MNVKQSFPNSFHIDIGFVRTGQISQKYTKLIHFRCAAHSLNRVAEKGKVSL